MRIPTALCLPLLLVLLTIVGCSEETAPEPDPYLSGVVTDASGTPVEGASIALVFGIDGLGLPGWEDPKKRIKTQIHFALAEPGRVRLWIEDYLRREVIVLIDEESEPGAHAVTWSFLNDAGEPVPPGFYFALLQWWENGPDEPPTTVEKELLLYDYEPEALYNRAHAKTDKRGNFDIPLALFPFGEEIRATDEGGGDLGMQPISKRVHVYAIVEEGGSFRYVDRYVKVQNRTDPVRVDLRLP